MMGINLKLSSFSFCLVFLLSCGPKVPGAPEAKLKVSVLRGIAPLAVVFDARSSVDRDGEIVSYDWDFGDGTLLSPGDTVEEHTYNEKGSFLAQLKVTDNEGKVDHKNVLIEVINPGEGEITLGNNISMSGEGCPAGTSSVTLTPDNKAVSIIFDTFLASAGELNPKFVRSSCQIAIPINVPEGYSLALHKIDYRGFASVAEAGKATFNVEYFYAGSAGPVLKKTFSSGFEDLFTLTHNLETFQDIYSPCGQQLILRVNASLTAESNSQGDFTHIQVDSADGVSGMFYHLKRKVCHP